MPRTSVPIGNDRLQREMQAEDEGHEIDEPFGQIASSTTCELDAGPGVDEDFRRHKRPKRLKIDRASLRICRQNWLSGLRIDFDLRQEIRERLITQVQSHADEMGIRRSESRRFFGQRREIEERTPGRGVAKSCGATKRSISLPKASRLPVRPTRTRNAVISRPTQRCRKTKIRRIIDGTSLRGRRRRRFPSGCFAACRSCPQGRFRTKTTKTGDRNAAAAGGIRQNSKRSEPRTEKGAP